eukprot:SAG31_NODE_1548_length_7914_cov_5.353423_8_plen_70_part_00
MVDREHTGTKFSTRVCDRKFSGAIRCPSDGFGPRAVPQCDTIGQILKDGLRDEGSHARARESILPEVTT